jgi:hypothetical protein
MLRNSFWWSFSNTAVAEVPLAQSENASGDGKYDFNPHLYLLSLDTIGTPVYKSSLCLLS